MTGKGLKEIGKKSDSNVDNSNNDDNNNSIEENKQNLEDLKQEIEEKQQEMNEKRRELQQQLDEEQRKLDDKKRELKLNIDTSGNKSKTQKVASIPNKEDLKVKEINNELTPSFMNAI